MDKVSARRKIKGQRNRTDLHVTKEKAKKGFAIKRKLMEECKSSKSRALLKSGILEVEKCKSIW